MNTRTIALAAVLSLSAGAAFAQSVPTNAVGKFLYDPQGETLGSVRGLTDGGRNAVIMIGFVGQPGSHEVTVPASALNVANGKIVLQAATMQALNVR